MSLDMTSFDSALKEYYHPGKILNMTYSDNPFLAILPKNEGFYGKSAPYPTIYGNPQGRSATFAVAQNRGQTSSSLLEDFTITRKKDYAVATIDSETMEAAENDQGAFLRSTKVEFNGAINQVSNSVASSLYRNGTGSIGVIASIASDVVTLVRRGDIQNYSKTMFVDIWTAETGGSQRGSVSVEIISVNRGLGQFTLASTPASTAAGDVLFAEGDRGLKLTGLDGWLPLTDPTSTPFFGVDRTQDITRLSGVRYDGSAQSIEEALIDGASIGMEEGGKDCKLDYCFLSFRKYAALEKALSTRVVYINVESKKAQVGFRGIELSGPKSLIKVLPDRNCFDDRAYLLTMDSWELMSLKKLVRVIDTDGMQMLRQGTADGVESRFGSYGQLACGGPGLNTVVKLE